MKRKVKIATILSTTFLVISCSSHESERRINIENPINREGDLVKAEGMMKKSFCNQGIISNE